MCVILRVQNKVRALWYKSAIWRAHLTPLSWIRDQRMLFVVGCYNSGTTLIADYIRQAQGYGGLKTEGDSLVPRIVTPEKLGYSRYPTACLASIDANTETLTASDAIWSHRIWAAAASPHPTRPTFVEKSISHGLRLNWLAKQFPDAGFIWVQRNPYCATEGMLRRSKLNKRLESLPDIQTAFAQWKLLNGRIAAFFRQSPRGGIIRYEDFTADPSGAVLPILERGGFFVEPPQAGDYTFRFHGKARRIENDNRRSLSRLTEEQFFEINELFGEDILAAGYDILDYLTI